MREYRLAPLGRRPQAAIVLHPGDDVAVARDLTVFEPDDAWQDTGLLDASGTPLMRRDRLGPIGFTAQIED
ncbi:hypothetical protein ACFQE0_13835 [Methylobacterium komagatae]|uniref:Uncharacterized protein n=1 Tax=Methylobacterium komagatae TaxID=374425 RepID=A0ABW2BLW2_9HYPH